MSDIAIKVTNLSKRYRIGMKEEIHDTFMGQITSFIKSPISNFKRLQKLSKFGNNSEQEDIIWALRHVSFEVKRGEVLGIIGGNGAGKTTLLKILSRITAPTSGRAIVNGRVGSLLEVGTGFHPELTGRENIFVNGAILGMTKREIERKFDEIVAFSEIEKFIDTPVKRYSSGMRIRLAFSVAAHLEPEILMIDEVLAVGDIEFQKKCLGKMDDVAKQGRTVLFVSHNMGAVATLCSRVIVIDHGGLENDGTPQDSITYYINKSRGFIGVPLKDRVDRLGSQKLKFTDIRILNKDGVSVETVLSGDDITIEVPYKVFEEPLTNVVFQFNFYDQMGQILFCCQTRTVNQNYKILNASGMICCHIPNISLAPGSYSLLISCKEKYGIRVDRIENAMQINVASGDFFGTGKMTPTDTGQFLVKHHWELKENVSVN